jgi:hypothetical protein
LAKGFSVGIASWMRLEPGITRGVRHDDDLDLFLTDPKKRDEP